MSHYIFRLLGSSSTPAGQRWKSITRRVGLGILLAVPLVLPFFGLNSYYLNLLIQVATYAIAVLGLVVVVGYAGQLNLAQAAFFGLGAYILAIATTSLHFSVLLGFVLGVLLVTLVGVVIGLSTLRLTGHYLAMATISFQLILTLVLVNWLPVTNGPDGITAIPRPSVLGYTFSTNQAYLLLSLVALYVVGYLVWRLRRSSLGRAMLAVRDDQLAAEVIGIKTYQTKVKAFAISAFVGGLGGTLFASGFSYISPDSFGVSLSILFLSMAVVGGAESVFGAVLGCTLLVLLPELLRFLKQIYLAVYGTAVIIMMVFMPEGIVGFVGLLFERFVPPLRPALKSATSLRIARRPTGSGMLLRLSQVTQRFGGLCALDGVDLQIERGSIHALIGPNGSGKTTLLNVLNGIYRPTSGKVEVNGQDVTGLPPHAVARRGVGRSFQAIRLFSTLTVLENVVIGAECHGHDEGSKEAALGQALAALDFVGLGDWASEPVRRLPYGHQKLVEIARALAGVPDLLLLDEPAGGLNPTEKQQLIELIYRIRSCGITILLIEHDMPMVQEVADRITVLNFGKKIAEGSTEDVLCHPEVLSAYLGMEGDYVSAGTA